MPTKTEVIQIRVDTVLLERFKAYADYQQLTLSNAIRRAMNNYSNQFEHQLEKQETAKLKQAHKK